MRVSLRPRTRLGDEHGITAMMTIFTIFALFGGAAIAVDLGNLWSSRRNVISASDASALAVASDYAVGLPGCELATVTDYVTANDEDASPTSCEPVGEPRQAGYVTVSAETPVDYAFAGVLGFPDRTVGAATAALWGVPSKVRGLRPFGLCKDDPHFQAWASNPVGISEPAVVFYNNEPTDCGGAPGNWGIIDLDNDLPVSNSDTKQWVRTGFSGAVGGGDIVGDPGAFSNDLDSALADVHLQKFPIPVFDKVTAIAGGGSNARFHVIGFVEVQLFDWRTTGSEDLRYLEIAFVESVATGDCCDPAGPDFGLKTVGICEVDPDFDPSNCT